jgi:hypothetical protein
VSLQRAEVTRIKDGHPFIVIPRLTGELEYGPLEALEGVVLAQGDRVLIGFLEGRADDPAIIRRLP